MNWKVILRSLKEHDMRKRIFAVLGILLVFRVLAHIPVPLDDPETLRQVLTNLVNTDSAQLLNFINVLSGGALANFSIMIVGLGPYINASIIMQLLTKAIPRLENLRKEGEFGQKKINQMTRMLTFPLAIIQSIGAIYLIRTQAQQVGGIPDITANADIMQWVLMVLAMTGGAMLLMWLGELVTEQSIGNGISLLITVSIVSALPQTVTGIVRPIFEGDGTTNIFGYALPVNTTPFIQGLIILLGVLLTTWVVVKLNEAARKLTVHYAKRVQGNRTYGGVTTTLPVKLITAGVVPIIFAVAFLSVPSFAGELLANNASQNLRELGANLSLWFQTPTQQTLVTGGWEAWIYPAAYFLLVVGFTFFYTSIAFNAKEISENLHKQGGFIAGVRSGASTERYLTKVVNRLTLFGSFSLGLLALLPIIGQVYVPNASIAIGGTSILILVSVALQTLRAVESRALMVTYDQYSSGDLFGPEDDGSGAGKSGKKSRRKLFTRRAKA